MDAKIVLLPGDGIGPEVVAQAERVLESVAERGGHAFHFVTCPIGGCAIDEFGDPLPERDAGRVSFVAGHSAWGRSAVRSGTIRGRRRGPRRACCGFARSWDSSPTCGRSPPIGSSSTPRRSSGASSRGSTSSSSAN